MKWGLYARAGQIASGSGGGTPSYYTINCYSDDGDGTSLCTTEPRLTPTVYSSTYSTIADAFANSSPIYSDSSLTTEARTGYYTDTLSTTYYLWDRGAWSTSTSCRR